jgi:cadmium resistance protein CadD (predicted permease)
MSITSWLTLAISGFVAWWGTGIDDTLALALLLKGQPRPLRRAMILGNALGVLLILIIVSLTVLGVLTIAPGLLDARLIGVPLLNLGGLLPMGIGGRALFNILTGRDDDEDDEENAAKRLTGRSVVGAAFIGMQIYLLNSFDDLSVHFGILSGVLQGSVLVPLSAYWLGTLLGELTSVSSASWLANRMQTRRTLEIAAALGVIIIGLLVLLGVFDGVST